MGFSPNEWKPSCVSDGRSQNTCNKPTSWSSVGYDDNDNGFRAIKWTWLNNGHTAEFHKLRRHCIAPANNWAQTNYVEVHMHKNGDDGITSCQHHRCCPVFTVCPKFHVNVKTIILTFLTKMGGNFALFPLDTPTKRNGLLSSVSCKKIPWTVCR